MAVNTTSFQFSASYGSVTTWRKQTSSLPKDMEEQIENGEHIRLEPKELSSEDAWQSLWGAKETETENADGTVTKSISGGMYFIRAGLDENGNTVSGKTFFGVSLTFDPSTYQGGQLGATADLLAAAHEASRQAAISGVSAGGSEWKGLTEADYQAQKETVAKSFAEMVGVPLEEQGHAGETEKIYQSVKAVFTSFEAKYQALTASLDNDSWMDADLWTSAANLRKLSASFHMESGKVQGLYSLRELEYTAIGVRSRLSLNA